MFICFYKRTAALLLFMALWFVAVDAKAEENKNPVDKNQIQLSGKFLVFGFLPMESPVTLFKRFAPLREYLAEQIARDIRLETAKDFPTFAERTLQRHYDIVFTAPHMALLALDSEKYEVAATFDKPLKAVIVVRAKSSVLSVEDLEGKTIATPAEEAIVTMVGRNFLGQKKGIKTARYFSYRTHNAAYAAVLGEEADAAIVSNYIAMKAIANNLPLKIIASSDPFPGIGILVARDLPESTRNDLKKAFWGMNELPYGRKILKQIAQPGYKEADKSPFEVLRPYVQVSLP